MNSGNGASSSAQPAAAPDNPNGATVTQSASQVTPPTQSAAYLSNLQAALASLKAHWDFDPNGSNQWLAFLNRDTFPSTHLDWGSWDDLKAAMDEASAENGPSRFAELRFMALMVLKALIDIHHLNAQIEFPERADQETTAEAFKNCQRVMEDVDKVFDNVADETKFPF